MSALTSLNAISSDLDIMREIQKVGYQETPLFSLLKLYTLRAKKSASPKDGFSWDYAIVPSGAANAHLEGAANTTPTAYETVRGKNHYQIFKDSYGVSGSLADQTQVDGTRQLDFQAAQAEIAHRKSIELALHGSAAPVARTSSVAGKLGGILSFVTAPTTVTASQANLTWEILREALKIAFLKGTALTHIFMNDTHKDELDDIIFNKVNLTNLGANKIENNVTVIGNTAYGNNVKVVLDPLLADDTILGINANQMGIVALRPTKAYELPATSDGVSEEYRTELTLFVDNPYAVVKIDLTPPSSGGGGGGGGGS